MRLARLFFLLVLPALIWHAPLLSSQPPPSPKKLSPWDLLQYENLTYDNLSTFVMNLMYEETSLLDSLWSVDETAHFIAYLARQGVSKWDTASQEELEHDIAWLLDDNDHSDLENEPYWLFSSQVAQAPIYLTLNDTSRPEILLCKSWVSKKWQKTKKFTKKHGKVIAIAAAVIVIAAVVIVVTNGAATPAVAVAAAASLDNQRDPINKAGEVRFKDDPSPEHEPEPEVRPSNPPITYQPTPEPIPTFTKEEKLALRESFQEKKEILKETLSEELPPEPLNIPPQDQPDYSQSLFDKTREKGAEFLHTLTETATNISKALPLTQGMVGYVIQEHEDQVHEALYHTHEKIDEAFGTNFGYSHTQQGKEEIAHVYDKLGVNLESDPNSVLDLQGKLSPGGVLGAVEKNLPALRNAGAVGTVAGVAAVVGSQMNPVIPLSVEQPTTVYRSTNLSTGQREYISISKELEAKTIEQAKRKNITIEPVEGLKNLPKADATDAERILTNLKDLPPNDPSRASQLKKISAANPQYSTLIEQELATPQPQPSKEGAQTPATSAVTIAPNSSPFNRTSTSSSNFFDHKLPTNPDYLLKNSKWEETSHPLAKERGHRMFENKETGEKLSFDEAKPGEPGHKGKSHWHRYNPNSTGDHDKYLDAQGNPVAKGSHESHLYSPDS
ncbi:MAG: hypothetical protein H7A38_02435 [Chlamydiales bacterium]|nr:hypothetical protein [Chlamydiales bacterium]